MRPLNDTIIPLQAAATVTSVLIPSMSLFAISAQITATGAGAGTLKMQASNDQPSDNSQPTNWVDITGATVTVAGAGAYMIPKTEICYQYVRFVYTNTGTGTIKVITKALGA